MFDSIISGLLNYNSNKATNAANQAIAEDTNRTNLQIAREGYANDVAMWNAQNAYNTPAAQMERLRAAGLNPQLVYAKGLSNTTSGYPTAPQPQMKAPHLQPYTGWNLGIFNAFGLMQQIKNDTKLKDAQALLATEEAKNKSYYRGRDVKNEDIYNETIRQQLKKLQNDNSLFPHQALNLELRNQKLSNDTEYDRYRRDNLTRGIDVEGGVEERATVLIARLLANIFGMRDWQFDAMLEYAAPVDRKNYHF